MRNDITVLVESIAGSRLYGTNRPDSDEDTRGVCLAPVGSLIGLDPAFEQIEESQPVDRVLTELRKFIKLALQNNPNILDTLFTPPEYWKCVHPAWKMIYELRHDVLSQRVRKTYVGYAVAQIKRIESHRKWLIDPPVQPKAEDYGGYDERNKWVWHDSEKKYKALLKEWNNYSEWLANRNPSRHKLEVQYGYDVKHAGHLVRLIVQAKSILMYGDFSPVLTAHEIHPVRSVMNGEAPYAQLVLYADQSFKDIEFMSTNLPEEPNQEHLNERIQYIYRAHIKNL